MVEEYIARIDEPVTREYRSDWLSEFPLQQLRREGVHPLLWFPAKKPGWAKN